jgi:antitoxin VapB
VAVNIKNAQVERLITEVATITGETKTEAVRRALEERRERLVLRRAGRDRYEQLRHLLERDVWPAVPPHVLDSPPLTRSEEEAILGFGAEGV